MRSWPSPHRRRFHQGAGCAIPTAGYRSMQPAIRRVALGSAGARKTSRMPNSVGGRRQKCGGRSLFQSVNLESPSRPMHSGRCRQWGLGRILLSVGRGRRRPTQWLDERCHPRCAALITLFNAAREAAKRIGYLTPLLYQSQGGATTTIGQAGCTDIHKPRPPLLWQSISTRLS